MSDWAPDGGTRPGLLHGTAAPLDSALRSALSGAIEAIYAAGENRNAAHEPSHSTPNAGLDAASSRLVECLNFWESRIKDRGLRHQQAFYHFHSPSNVQEFQSWVMADGMSAADAVLVRQLRQVCPRFGFEVLPVVLEYTGTSCQYNAWVPDRQPDGHTSPARIGQNGRWKTYQHVRHSARVHQLKTFPGATFAEGIDCHQGSILDDRNVAWERARRGVFSWQGPHEQQLFEEERNARKTNPKWYQEIIPGSTADLGTYFAPAIMIVPLSTQLESIDRTSRSLPAKYVWQYLLRQCKESDKAACYFAALKAACHFVLPETDDAPAETQVLGMRVRNRQDWIDAVEPRIMGDLLLASLMFNDLGLFEHLAANTKVYPMIDYNWICENASVYGYSAADALKPLRRFLLRGGDFLQFVNAMDKIPAHAKNSEAAEFAAELVKAALATHLKAPLSASHGRAVVNFLKFFRDFQSWSEMVDLAINTHSELWKHNQFTLGLLNRLLEVAFQDKLPLDQVEIFYRRYEELIITTTSSGHVGRLVSDALTDQGPKTETARQTWLEAEPTTTTTTSIDAANSDVPPPTSYAVIAGLFRNLDRLGMHKESANLADHIIKRRDEIRPIHVAQLWLPCLRILQDLTDPEISSYRRLFQAIFELYEQMVFDDMSTHLEQDPESISPMTPCCKHCQGLDPFLEQPKWMRLHLVKERQAVDHIQSQLHKQEKPIEITIYGKNESSLTMQLAKVSLINKKIRKVQELRRREAAEAIRLFDRDRLLLFLGNKGDIVQKLASAESQQPLTNDEKTPARPSITSRTSSGGSAAAGLLRRTSSPSTAGAPTGSPPTATPPSGFRDRRVKTETASSTDSARNRVTQKIESSGRGLVETQPSGIPGSAERTAQGARGMQDVLTRTFKKESAQSSSQGWSQSTAAARDREKNLAGGPRRESMPKSHTRDATAAAGTSRLSGSGGASELPRARDPLASFGGIRNKEPVRTGTLVDGSSRNSKAPAPMKGFGLAGRSNADPGHPSTSPRSAYLLRTFQTQSGTVDNAKDSPSTYPKPSLSLSHSTRRPDFMSAVLEAERARKKRKKERSTGSTWEARRTASSGDFVSAGGRTSSLSSAAVDAGKASFDSLGGVVGGQEDETPAVVVAAGTWTKKTKPDKPYHHHLSGALAPRSPNVITGRAAEIRAPSFLSPCSAGSKRSKTVSDDYDEDVIDLCGDDGPEPIASSTNKRKRAAAFISDPFDDDDPFAD